MCLCIAFFVYFHHICVGFVILSFSFIADSQEYMSMLSFSHVTPQYLRPADTILNSIKYFRNYITFLCAVINLERLSRCCSHTFCVWILQRFSILPAEFILLGWMDRGKTGNISSSLLSTTQTHNIFISGTEKYTAMNFDNSSVYKRLRCMYHTKLLVASNLQ